MSADVTLVISPERTGHAFHYLPLLDPSKQFRLFRIPLRNPADVTSIELTTWTIEEAPSYGAISYVWGNAKDCRRIRVNGDTMSIGENCWYALRQLRQHNPCAYYWLDAICINQTDIAERSSQVDVMGDIFSQAQCVFACVGSHADGSELLVQELRRFAKVMPKSPRPDELDHLRHRVAPVWDRSLLNKEPDPIDRWYWAHDYEARKMLMFTLILFGQRQYWERLWVVQELVEARKRKVLCDHVQIDWQVLNATCRELTYTYTNPGRVAKGCYGYSEMERALNTLEISPMVQILDATAASDAGDEHYVPMGPHFAQRPRFCNHLYNFQSRKCLEPRDMIFGLKGLRGWPEDVPDLRADYALPLVSLALTAISCYYPNKAFTFPRYVQTVKSVLHIDDNGEEIASLMRKRRCQPQDVCLNANYPNKDFEARTHVRLPMKANANHVLSAARSDNAGELTAGLCVIWSSGKTPDAQHVMSTEQMLSLCHQRGVSDPKVLLADGEPHIIAGLVCSTVQPGDILLQLGDEYFSDFTLVIRSLSSTRFMIVGQAVLKYWYRIWNDSWRPFPDLDICDDCEHYRDEYEVWFDAEDLLVILSQTAYHRGMSSSQPDHFQAMASRWTLEGAETEHETSPFSKDWKSFAGSRASSVTSAPEKAKPEADGDRSHRIEPDAVFEWFQNPIECLLQAVTRTSCSSYVEHIGTQVSQSRGHKCHHVRLPVSSARNSITASRSRSL